MAEKVLTSVHIEKAGGSTIENFFETQLGCQRVAYYHAPSDRLIRSSDFILSPSNPVVDAVKEKVMGTPYWSVLKKLYFLIGSREQVRKEDPIIPNGVRVIHGHFRADRFDTEIDSPIRAVALREPLQRMHSHFSHWRRTRGNAEWRVRINYDLKIQFVDFAMLPQLQNYQAQALAGKELTDFDAVGIVEQLDLYALLLHEILLREGFYQTKPKTPNPLRRLNHTPQQEKKVYPATKQKFDEEVFRQFHSIDYELYGQAVALASNRN